MISKDRTTVFLFDQRGLFGGRYNGRHNGRSLASGVATAARPFVSKNN